MIRYRLLALAAGLAVTVAVQAATFPYFGPVTGVLKGSASSPQTSAAVYTDIVTMWTGCGTPSTKVLMADGTCAVPASVTPAALTKTDDTNVTVTLGGTPTTALLQATSLTLGWTGTLAASRGGLGMSTVTDDTVAVANGSAWQSKALTDCDAATSAVTYDTTTNAWGCNTISGATGANPSGTVGLSAVNGVAATFLRSDGAPALSQAIVPTWSAVHTFSARPVFNDGITVNDAGRNVASLTDTAQSYGNSTDNPTYSWAGTGLATFAGPVTITNRQFSAGGGTNSSTAVQLCSSGGWYGVVGVNVACTSTQDVYNYGTSDVAGLIDFKNTGVGNGFALKYAASGTVGNPITFTTAATFTTGGASIGAPTGALQGAGTINATAMYDDGALLPSLVSTPTWTGTHTHSYTGSGEQIRLARDNAFLSFYNTANSVRSGYLQIAATSTSTLAVEVAQGLDLATSGVTRMNIGASGGLTIGSPTSGNQGNGTINATGLYINGIPVSGGATSTGSFTATQTGLTAGVTCSMKYRLTGTMVFLYNTANCLGTSNANTFTFTGLPVDIRPNRAVSCMTFGQQDSGAAVVGAADIGGGITAGTVQIDKQIVSGGNIVVSASAWTASGAKGLTSVWTCIYDLDS